MTPDKFDVSRDLKLNVFVYPTLFGTEPAGKGQSCRYIADYARRKGFAIMGASIKRTGGNGGRVTVYYEGTAQVARVDFSSYAHGLAWLKARDNWGIALQRAKSNSAYFGKPGEGRRRLILEEKS